MHYPRFEGETTDAAPIDDRAEFLAGIDLVLAGFASLARNEGQRH